MIAKVLHFLPSRHFGAARMTSCEGRGCPDRSAPVFVVGALLLCGACRDYRNRLTRQALPRLRAQALQNGGLR